MKRRVGKNAKHYDLNATRSLWGAVERDDGAEIKRLVAAGGDLGVRGQLHVPALGHGGLRPVRDGLLDTAIENKAPDALAALIESGIPMRRSAGGEHPFHKAIRAGWVDGVDLMMRARADFSATSPVENYSGDTPVETVRFLWKRVGQELLEEAMMTQLFTRHGKGRVKADRLLGNLLARGDKARLARLEQGLPELGEQIRVALADKGVCEALLGDAGVWIGHRGTLELIGELARRAPCGQDLGGSVAGDVKAAWNAARLEARPRQAAGATRSRV